MFFFCVFDDGDLQSFAYDIDGQLIGVPNATSMTRDALGRLTRMEHSNGYKQEWTHDSNRDWVLETSLRDNFGISRFSLTISRNPRGEPISGVLNDKFGRESFQNDYDSLGRLETVLRDSGANEGFGFSQDSSLQESLSMGRYSYSSHLQTPDYIDRLGGLSYDLAGNRVGGPAGQLFWDDHGRLSVTEFSDKTWYKFYVSGELASIRTNTAIVRLFDKSFERVGSRVTKNIFADGLLVARRQGFSAFSVVASDLLGTPVAEVDSTSAAAVRMSSLGTARDGAPIAASDPLAWGLAGNRYVVSSDLIVMGMRVYEPKSGLFLSVDPETTLVAGSRSINRYAYAASNPALFYDPSGGSPEERAAILAYYTNWLTLTTSSGHRGGTENGMYNDFLASTSTVSSLCGGARAWPCGEQAANLLADMAASGLLKDYKPPEWAVVAGFDKGLAHQWVYLASMADSEQLILDPFLGSAWRNDYFGILAFDPSDEPLPIPFIGAAFSSNLFPSASGDRGWERFYRWDAPWNYYQQSGVPSRTAQGNGGQPWTYPVLPSMSGVPSRTAWGNGGGW